MSGFMPKHLDASKKEAYDLAVLKFVVADGRPFETAAGVGFQNLCAVISRLLIASRQHIGPHGTLARCTLQFVRRCYGLSGIYGRFDSKIRFEIESDGRFDSRFDSNAKKNDSQLPNFRPCLYLFIF